MAGRINRLQDEIDILEYRSGDLGAFERLLARWQPRIYRYIAAMVGEADAWDVSQEVWLAVVRAFGRPAHVEYFAAWVYRLTHNRCVSHLRRGRRLGEIDEASVEARDGRADGGEESAVRSEDARLVRECLSELSLPLREAMLLFHMEGLSLDEVGGILDVPRGTVQSRLHAGRAKLRELLTRKGYRHE